jgi:TM2 domain-containing membrane protein YozV
LKDKRFLALPSGFHDQRSIFKSANASFLKKNRIYALTTFLSPQRPYLRSTMLNKNLAGFFAVFLGMFGVHYFYIGKWWKGVAQFAAFWGFILLVAESGEALFGMMIAATVISAVITGIIWWATPQDNWLAKYDPKALAENNLISTGIPLPADTKSLKEEGIRYYRSADYDLAIEAFLEAVDADVSDPGTHFNLACSYAQLGQYPESMRHLELSVTFGLPKPERIEKHPALAAMRKHSAFQSFRDNNYRRLNLVELSPAAPRPSAETLEDFGSRSTPTAAAQPTPAPAAAPQTAAPTEETTSAAYDDAPAPAMDLLEQITRLRELHDAGILTQGEYQKQKEKLLG